MIYIYDTHISKYIKQVTMSIPNFSTDKKIVNNKDESNKSGQYK